MNDILHAIELYENQHEEVGLAMARFKEAIKELHGYYENVSRVEVREIKKRGSRKKRVDNGETQYGTA